MNISWSREIKKNIFFLSFPQNLSFFWTKYDFCRYTVNLVIFFIDKKFPGERCFVYLLFIFVVIALLLGLTTVFEQLYLLSFVSCRVAWSEQRCWFTLATNNCQRERRKDQRREPQTLEWELSRPCRLGMLNSNLIIRIPNDNIPFFFRSGSGSD